MPYSQNDEEGVILKYFDGKPTGRLLDVGAYDGKTFSNSAALIDKGWEGVLVEPASGPFQALLDRYSENPRLSLLNAALAGVWGMTPFWSSRDAVSTTVPGHAEKWASRAAYAQCIIPTVPVKAFISRFGNGFDFINVDVESANFDLTALLYEANCRPRLWCIEHDGKIEELMLLLAPFGYKPIHQTGENLLLALP